MRTDSNQYIAHFFFLVNRACLYHTCLCTQCQLVLLPSSLEMLARGTTYMIYFYHGRYTWQSYNGLTVAESFIGADGYCRRKGRNETAHDLFTTAHDDRSSLVASWTWAIVAVRTRLKTRPRLSRVISLARTWTGVSIISLLYQYHYQSMSTITVSVSVSLWLCLCPMAMNMNYDVMSTVWITSHNINSDNLHFINKQQIVLQSHNCWTYRFYSKENKAKITPVPFLVFQFLLYTVPITIFSRTFYFDCVSVTSNASPPLYQRRPEHFFWERERKRRTYTHAHTHTHTALDRDREGGKTTTTTTIWYSLYRSRVN